MGSKRTSAHSTFIDTNSAKLVIRFAENSPLVDKFTLGIIVPKKPPSRFDPPTKISITRSHLRVDLNSKSTNQEIHIYGKDIQKIAESLARKLRDEGLEIKFGKHEKSRLGEIKAKF